MSKVEISKRLVVVNSASAVAAQLLNLSVLVWLQQYLLRRISADEYAIYAVVMGVIVFFVPLLSAILTSGLGRYIVEAYATNDEQRIVQIVSTMFVVLLAAGILLLVLGLIFAWYVDRALVIPPRCLWDARMMTALLVLSFAVSLPLAPFNVGLYVRQRFVLSNAINVASELFRISILLVLLLGVSTRVLWVVVASVTSQITTQVVTVTISRRLVPSLRFRVGQIRWALARPLVSFGSWSFVGNIANSIRNASDPLILNRLSTSFDVSCFNLANLVVRQFDNGVGLIVGPVQPPLTAMHVTGDQSRLQSTYLRVGRFALWLTFLVVGPMVVFHRELGHLYVGWDYRDAAALMALLLGSAPIWYGHVMLPMVTVAKAQLRPMACRSLAIQVCNVALTLYLVGVLHLGMWGSVLGTVIANAIGVPALMYPLAFRMTGLRARVWFRQTVMPAVVPAFVSIGVCLALRYIVSPASWPSLIACMGAGALSYVAAVAAWGMQSQDRADVMHVLLQLKRIPARLVPND